MTQLLKSVAHIGLHKTGTTSLQRFMQTNRERLAELGIHFYQGNYIVSNHAELHAAAMRFDRTSTFKMKRKIDFDDAYRQQTADSIAAFVGSIGAEDTALYSAEGLALLRYKDETDRLAEYLNRPTSIIVYLRKLEDYLRSHKNQLAKVGIVETSDKDSHAYLEPDGWMADYELRLKAYRQTFGEEHVHIVDYDAANARDGNVIPSFLDLLGVSEHFTKQDWGEFRLNQS